VDTRTARRAAEKAARDLINARSAVIGELGVAHAERLRLAADVDNAAEEGQRLRVAAAARAADLMAAAHDGERTGEERYTDALAAAVAAGWTMSDLRAMGFPDGRSTSRRRRVKHGGDAAGASLARRPIGAREAEPG
jgi:hypothetical protein